MNSRQTMRFGLLLALTLATAFGLPASLSAADPPYTQEMNVVYAETDGIGLVMDVFRPTGTPNGLAIVDIACGAWNSDRGKINDHKQAQMFDIFCSRGYVVFAVRPGSVAKFTVPEMVKNVKTGIRYVRLHHDDYKIDPQRMALTGASAGGHLTCLTAATADDGNADAKNPIDREGCRMQCCVAFFPPTDFLDWGGLKVDPKDPKGLVPSMLRRLLVVGGGDPSKEVTIEEITAISPARLVNSQTPPMLLIHGDADPIVPLQQSHVMLDALKKVGVPAELIVKKGGGHPWLTINEEVKVAADWIDKQLASAK